MPAPVLPTTSSVPRHYLDQKGLVRNPEQKVSVGVCEEALGAGQVSLDNLVTAEDLLLSWDELVRLAVKSGGEGLAELTKGEVAKALFYLRRAQDLLSRSESLCGPRQEDRQAQAAAQSDAASNLGMLYRREKKQALAVWHLQRSLEFCEAAGGDMRKSAKIHLSLAACYLEVTMPAEALDHATAALEHAGRLVATPEVGAVGRASPSDDYAMLAVAYHKVAEANEGLRKWSTASFAYTQAHEVVKLSLGADHRITKTFEKSPRCPKAVVTPRVPIAWFSTATERWLPSVPSARPKTADMDLSCYKLDPALFQSWPPKSMDREEKAWYAMARKHEEVVRAHSVAEVKRASTAQRSPSGAGGDRSAGFRASPKRMQQSVARVC